MTEETKDRTLFSPEDPAEAEALQKRLDAFLSAIGSWLLRREKDRWEHWEEGLADLVFNGLNALKQYIEDPEVKEVSWESPWAEVRYIVEWDWERGELRFKIPDLPDFITEALAKGEDPEELAKDPEVQKVLMENVGRPYLPLSLQVITKEVAVQLKGEQVAGFYFLSADVKNELDELPTDEERAARFKSLLEPNGIGGLQVITEEGPPFIVTPYTWAKIKTGTSPELAETIEKKLADVPEMAFTGEVQGVPYKGSVVMMFHPLVVDEDKKEAYFPVVTGLVFGLIEPVSEKWQDIGEWAKADLALGPAAWEEKDREALWESLLVGLVDELRKTSKVPAEEEAHVKDTVLEVQSAHHVVKTSPITLTIQAPSPTIITTGAPPRERRPTAGVAFGYALASAQAMSIIRDSHKVRLPKKWSTLKRWEKLVDEEVRDIQEEEGDRAFEDLRKTTGDREERGPLLRRVTKSDGRELIVLTAEAQDRLRRRAALTGRGYIGIDKWGMERLFRQYEIGRGGLLEVSLSWQGLAGPLVDEWRSEKKHETEELARDLKKEAPLFAELDEEKRKRVDHRLAQLSLWEDGRLIMEAILGQVGKQRRNPVEIPAEAFRVLLWSKKAKSGDWPPNWKQRVEGALSALNALTFDVRTYRTETFRTYGSMVGQWTYKPLGPGDHGDGVYIIDVSSNFMGCLRVFQGDKIRLRSGREAVSFFFDKDLTPEERKALGWGKGEKATDTFVTFDAGRPFYNAAAGLSSTQGHLLQFIELNITLRKNTARKGNKTAQVHRKAKTADLPRLYGTDFCPLLPEGQKFFGALGRFKRNPEAGFTLWGSESRAARHPGGLLYHMGHTLPSGSARAKRAKAVQKALEDIRAVMVDHLGGIVAGYHGGEWVAFEDFGGLDERTLTRRLRIFFFLPEDWEATRRAKYEETTGRRVTEDVAEAEREAWGEDAEERPLGSEVATGETGFRGWSLHERLRAMMIERGLRQKDLAVMFGVSAPVITYWLKGTEPDEDGKVRGKAIPEDVAELIVRWVETGVPPTVEELEAMRARREKKPGKKKAQN